MSDTNTASNGGEGADVETNDDPFTSALAEVMAGEADEGGHTHSGETQARTGGVAAPANPNNRETPAAGADKAAPAPDRWSAEEQAEFAKLPPEAKALVEKRVAAIEADYNQRTQGVSASIELADGVRKIADGFRDRLQSSGMNELQGIQYLADLERFATTQPADYLRFVAEHVRQMGVDPAKELGFGEQSKPVDGDPFTDPRVGKLEGDIGNLRNHIQQDAQRRAMATANDQIAAFRDAKDQSGTPLRPHFTAVENEMASLIRANPGMTLEQAYDKAVWSDPAVRGQVQQAEREAVDKKAREEAAEAARARRGNIRPGSRTMASSPTIETADDAARAALAELNL